MIPARARRVFEKVLGVDSGQLDLSTSQESLEGWDSVSHIELVLALEMEFDVQFTTLEFSRMTTLANILSLLREKGRL
jgi:acyl carrier protein